MILIDDTTAQDYFFDIEKECRSLRRQIGKLHHKQWRIVQYARRKKHIDDTEFEVIKLRWGFGYLSRAPLSIGDTAKVLNISKDRVVHIQQEALANLKKIHGSNVLEYVR